MELVALGMSTEVVMIFDNQNFSIRSSLLLKKVGRSKPADATTNNNQIIFFSGVYRFV